MKLDDGFLPLAAALLSNVLWGSSFMASKAVLAVCPPITAITFRFGIALAAFLIVRFFRRTPWQFTELKKQLPAVVALGLCGYTALYIFQMSALKFITSSESAAIMLLAPVFTFLCESLVRKKINPREILVTLVGLAGAGLILFDRAHLTVSANGHGGLLMTVIAAACLGISVVQTKRVLWPNSAGEVLSVFNLTFYSILIGAIGLVPFSFFELGQHVSEFRPNPQFWLWLLYLGVFCSVIAFALWNWSIKYVSPVGVAIAMYLKTPVAFGLGAMILNEKLTPLFYLGSLIILLSVFGNQLLMATRNK